MEKLKVNSDTLYKYLLEHGIKMVRIAELTGLSEASINVCFKHTKGSNGIPRTFTPKAIVKLNKALDQIAEELRKSLLKFGSDDVFTNQRGNTYDPALIEPVKQIGEYMNLTALVERVLGWSKMKKESILVTPTSKAYGNISSSDVDMINNELLSVAGVLSSYEVVVGSDNDSHNPGSDKEI